jgi:hypothetical protein
MERMARKDNSRNYAGFGNNDTVSSHSSNDSQKRIGENVLKDFGGTTFNSSTLPSTTATPVASSTASTMVMTMADQNSAAPLPGESDADYLKRQMRIREEAQTKSLESSKMASKSTKTVQQQQQPKKATSVTKLKVSSDDDFFASFGA